MRRLPLLLGSTLAALLLGELVVRQIHPLERAHPPLYEYDRELGWRQTPGLALEVRNSEGVDIPIRINRDGFRGADRPPVKSAGTVRILVFGDSFTEGLSVREDESFSELLERELNNSGNGTYEVFGLGVASYGTAHSLLRLRQVADRFDPDLVVFQVCVNDFWDNVETLSYQRRGPWAEESADDAAGVRLIPVSASRDPSVPAPRRLWRRPLSWLKWHSALVQVSLRVLMPESREAPARRPAAPRALVAPTDPTTDPRFESSRRVTARLLRLAALEAASRGSRFLAYFNPSTLRFTPPSIYRANGRTEEFRLDGEVERWLIDPVLEECRAEQIRCHWSRDLFAGEFDAARAVTVRDDPHWNERGHRLVADDLLPLVVDALGRAPAANAEAAADPREQIPAQTPK